jgi:hypothetical protein
LSSDAAYLENCLNDILQEFKMRIISFLILIFFGTVCFYGCKGKEVPKPIESQSDQFSVGQVWQSKTRPIEVESRLIVGRIDRIKNKGNIVHIKLVGLKINNTKAPGGFSTELSHAPVSEEKLKDSVTVLEGNDGDLSGFQEGYETWLQSYEVSGAGVFTTSVAEIVDIIEQALN